VLTMSSILRLYLALTSLRYSGLISRVAYSSALRRMPARWHSITVDVRMGTTWRGKREMLRATRTCGGSTGGSDRLVAGPTAVYGDLLLQVHWESPTSCMLGSTAC
jgi:hypothetical protein